MPPITPHGFVDHNNRGGGYRVSYCAATNSSGSASTPVNAPSSIDENDQEDHDKDDEKKVPPTLTFNEKAREIQGDKAHTMHQQAMERIVDNWTPQ